MRSPEFRSEAREAQASPEHQPRGCMIPDLMARKHGEATGPLPTATVIDEDPYTHRGIASHLACGKCAVSTIVFRDETWAISFIAEAPYGPTLADCPEL